MKNFRLIALLPREAYQPLLLDLHNNPAVWYLHTERQDHPISPHRHTKSIWFRGPAEMTLESVFGLSVVDYTAEQRALPSADLLVSRLMTYLQRHEGKQLLLGRAMVVSLFPGGHITSHKDEGPYAKVYTRAHFCLWAAKGNQFNCGDETVEMWPGEFWWFNHQLEHSVTNNSPVERIHFILDYKLL